MTEERDDKRQHSRFAVEMPVGVTVRACRTDPSLKWKQYRCASRDASVCGLQLQSVVFFPPGAELGLDVTIHEGDRAETLTLVGDVVWCNEAPGAGYVAGIFLRERPRRAMQVWMDTISAEVRQRFRAE